MQICTTLHDLQTTMKLDFFYAKQKGNIKHNWGECFNKIFNICPVLNQTQNATAAAM